MKIRTDQAFNGRRVRLGDPAIVCELVRVFDRETGAIKENRQAKAANCCGFNGDEPEWCIVGEMGAVFPAPTPKIVIARFVETEGELVPGTWTW